VCGFLFLCVGYGFVDSVLRWIRAFVGGSAIYVVVWCVGCGSVMAVCVDISVLQSGMVWY